MIWIREHRSASRVALAVLAALGLSLVLTPPASADAHLVSSDPAEAAVLAASPSALTLTFSEPVNPVAVSVTPAAPNAAPLAVPAPSAQDRTVTQPVPALANGAYRLSYEVTSADGHKVSGTVNFSVDAPTSAAPTTSTTPSTSSEAAPSSPAPSVAPVADTAGESSSVGWIVGAVLTVLVLAGVGFWLVRRRRA